MSYLKRMFDAPQRRVCFESLQQTSLGSSVDIEFQIGGAHIDIGGATSFTEFLAMAEQGVQRFDQRELSIWQRIRRVPARIGAYREDPDGRIQVTFWTDPALVFAIETASEEGLIRWRELFGLVRAAGFELGLER